LHEQISRALSGFTDVPAPLRFDPGFDSPHPQARTPVPGTPRVLLLGRLDDTELKGLDIGARAIGYAIGTRTADESDLEFRVRGAAPGQAVQLRKVIQEWTGIPGLHVEVQNFSTDPARLRHELRLASLVLMPSRAEGFGLVGLEAIVEGVPVLVSGKSGLGQLLRECLPAEDAVRTVIPVEDDQGRDTQRWGCAIAAVLRDRKAAFANADTIRRTMAEQRTWAMAVTRLLDPQATGSVLCSDSPG
jgi:glycosyltransferase involved in cell wall biosynthesis